MSDLTGTPPDQLPAWDPEKPGESLERLFERFVVTKLTETMEWYFKKRVYKRLVGRGVRVLGVLAAGAGVLIPMLTELWTTEQTVSRPAADPNTAAETISMSEPVISAGWAAVALLLGAGLMWIDRFLDGTSGWVRYVTTGLDAADMRDEAVLGWRALTAGWKGEPDEGQIAAAMAFIATYNDKACKLVRDETERWREGFQSSLEQLDKLVKAREQRSSAVLANEAVGSAETAEGDEQTNAQEATGSAEIFVSFEHLESCSIRLVRDDDPADLREQQGPEANFADLTPGAWTVAAKGKARKSANGRPSTFNETAPVDVEAGATTHVTLPAEPADG